MRLSVKPSKTNLIKAGIFTACVTFLGILSPAALHASPVTYDLTLTATSGSYGGTGLVTVEGAVPSSGQHDYTVALGNLDNLSFTIDNQTFTLAGDTNALVRFYNGQINDITFAETLGSGLSSFTLDTSGNYAFYYYVGNTIKESAGNFALTPGNTSPVPEPGSIAFLATGLLGGAGSLYRRYTSKRIS